MRVTRGRCLLQDWIDSKGWTQAEYAKRSGRPKRMISHFCKNDRVMKPEDEYTAALILNCRMEDLHEWIVEHDDKE